MTRRLAPVLFGLSVLVIAPPLFAETGPPQSFEVTRTEHLNFARGGTIRVNGSYGYLSVDGWDQPEVQITITKSTDRFYTPDDEKKAKERLDRVRVEVERRSDTELAITTTRPPRHRTWAPPPLSTGKVGITVDCQVYVPRNSRLVIHHDSGYVWLGDTSGEIEATSHTGDMIVLIPVPAQYSIDARTGAGSVSSGLPGDGRKQFLFGTRFVRAGESPARRVYLRMGRGNITLVESPISQPLKAN